MYSYTAYGLGIDSALPLPELVEGSEKADAHIRFGKVKCAAWPPRLWGYHVHASAREFGFMRAGLGAFLIREGREIIIDPAPDVEACQLRLSLLGPALAFLLHQRGLLVLHASAVQIEDRAVAFLGGSGQGKSTIAAALHTRGHGLVADDVIAVHLSMDGFTVYPAFPQLKLWPSTIALLDDMSENLPRLHSQLEKRACRTSSGFASTPLPLRLIYVLAEGSPQKIEALPPQESLLELVRHSYVARFLEKTDTAATHFRQCAHVSTRLPVCRLTAQRSTGALDALIRLVEEDAASG